MNGMESAGENTHSKAKNIEIAPDNKTATANFEHLELTLENPASRAVTITVEKKPIVMNYGDSYPGLNVLVDESLEEYTDLINQAEAIKSLPESERPRETLELLRSNLQYVYSDVLERLKGEDTELYEWVRDNVSLQRGQTIVPLTEVLKNGYGVCEHFAAAYLWLAHKAGLRGVIQTVGPETIVNIKRLDTDEKLFKSIGVGEQVTSGHAWNEIQLSSGEWIPVDPTTQLVGDTQEGRRMFEEANYISYADDLLMASPEPRSELDTVRDQPPIFKPGAHSASGSYKLQLSKPPIRIGKRAAEPDTAEQKTSYSGPGKIRFASNDTRGGFNIDIVEVI